MSSSVRPRVSTPKIASQMAMKMASAELITYAPSAVSYTHLDVYKRQGVMFYWCAFHGDLDAASLIDRKLASYLSTIEVKN